jgi:2-keto-4-pentenoate hydratase/2-oxohepta-3-ene-1,7-dioic acid hydratase in catechol pathway
VNYQHSYWDGNALPLPVGKVVAVGRNYLEHVRELNNSVPETPILFMKPSTALVDLRYPLHLPNGRGSCHHEVELAVLIGKTLHQAHPENVPLAVVGYAIALDLTLRDLQAELKKKGYPWEIAKAFDGSCPISAFLKPEDFPDPQDIEFSLTVNDLVRQQGNTRDMIWSIYNLIAYITTHFTLLPGDVVLTGTPAGVGELHPGDKLLMRLAKRYAFSTQIA